MYSGKIVAGRVDGTGGESKVLQEVLADLKKAAPPFAITKYPSCVFAGDPTSLEKKYKTAQSKTL